MGSGVLWLQPPHRTSPEDEHVSGQTDEQTGHVLVRHLPDGSTVIAEEHTTTDDELRTMAVGGTVNLRLLVDPDQSYGCALPHPDSRPTPTLVLTTAEYERIRAVINRTTINVNRARTAHSHPLRHVTGQAGRAGEAEHRQDG